MAIEKIIGSLSAHQARAKRSLNLTPSENILSPLAKVPLVADCYSRYFFPHFDIHGFWMFYSGLEAGQIEKNILHKLIKEMTDATYVETRPLSGLHGMTIIISALCSPGGTMAIVPMASGGHMCTPQIAKRLGVKTVDIPMLNDFEIDEAGLEELLRNEKIELIYIDQSSQLFPLDPKVIKRAMISTGSEALLHCDTSHTNGLVLGGVLGNPLDAGADLFGGSTHKTLPGPHKAFVATRNKEISEKINSACHDLISHHQVSASISLAITLEEFKEKDGELYASKIVENARLIAETLHQRGLHVSGRDLGFTSCHQIWVENQHGRDIHKISNLLYNNGLLLNIIPGLPEMEGLAFRLSSAEFTRLGADREDAELLANVLADVFLSENVTQANRVAITDLVSKLNRAKYCYEASEIEALGFHDELLQMAKIFGA